STAAATSGPASEPRPASSAPATKRTPSSRSNLNSRRWAEPRRPRRLEEPDAAGGPVGGEGSPDDPTLGDGAPEAAVVGRPTVVAHHEPMSGRKADRFREIAVGTSGAALPDVGLVDEPPVADHVAVGD